jgi:hypothetical protein
MKSYSTGSDFRKYIVVVSAQTFIPSRASQGRGRPVNFSKVVVLAARKPPQNTPMASRTLLSRQMPVASHIRARRVESRLGALIVDGA